MDGDNEVRQQLKSRFANFLEREFESGKKTFTYRDQLWNSDLDVINRRVIISEHHIRQHDESLLQKLLTQPGDSLPAFEDALKELAKSGFDDRVTKALQVNDEVRIGLTGDFGWHEVSPRDLNSRLLNQLVCVFGIVTKCSLVRPKIVKSVHYCEATKEFSTMEYRDITSTRGAPTTAAYPQRDDKANPLTTEFGLCHYKDNQNVSIQELPETAPPGQLPHSIEIVLEDDLVDRCKPGDRVSIVGVYKTVASRGGGPVTGVFKAVLVGLTVNKLDKEALSNISTSDMTQITDLAEEPEILERLAASLAPSIYGHDIIKKGLILMLFGGQEKNLENGTHLRGDINCLMVGDPGVAKSQLLRAIMNVAPLAVSTTGRGSSGVGLTAAVTTDNETGEKRLEAGAMVLADRGVVCIDEFDKMSDQDRVAIHEVMEQQTVTIAKAGIHCSLNARCSVLAAANPLYGSYDKSIPITKNINLPDSLLSRFDMLFIVLDSMDEAVDKEIAAHVLRQHMYRAPGEDGTGLELRPSIHDRPLGADDAAHGRDNEKSIYLRQDTSSSRLGGDVQPFTSDFLRKYIIYTRKLYRARARLMAITDEAGRAIAEFYAQLRGQMANADKRTAAALPVTARTLETLIRLSTSNAKVHLRMEVTADDVAVAISILKHVMRDDLSPISINRKFADGDDEGEELSGNKQKKRSRGKAEYSPEGTERPAEASNDATMGEAAGGSDVAMETDAPAEDAAAATRPSGSRVNRADVEARSDGSFVMDDSGLSEKEKKAVIDILVNLRNEIGSDGSATLSVVQGEMTLKGMTVSVEGLEKILTWMSEHEAWCAKAHLPRILFTEDFCIFFTV